MEILLYFLKANIFLVVFYAFYFCFFKNETFHKANRYFLVLGAIIALLLPFVRSSQMQKPEIVSTEIKSVAYELYFQSEEVIVSSAVETYSYFDILKYSYLLGLIVAGITLLARITKTIFWLKTNKKVNGTAFSFLGKIFIDNHLEQKSVIFKHEDIHVKQMHFLDLIFFEMLQIVFWINPVIYFYKKSISIIHEFLADEEASKIAQDKIAYASLLVSKQFSIQPATVFTQHFFNHSTLKSRIIMLSKNPSKKTALLKYGLLAPAFFVMLAISSFTVVDNPKMENIFNNLNNEINQNSFKDLGFPSSTKAFVNEEVGILETGETIESGNNNILNFLPDNEVAGVEDLSFPSIEVDTFPQNNSNKQIFTTAEQNPEFIGGQAELYKWLAKNIKYPLEAKNNKIEGRVYVRFVIEANGEIGEVKVMKGIGYGCDEEAARVLQAMPNWKPAMQNGYPVAIYYNIPIVFKWHKNVVDEHMMVIEHEEATKNRKFSVVSYPSSKNKSPKFKLGNEKINPIIIIDNEIIKDTRGIDIKMINSDYSSFKFLIPQKAIPLYGNQAKDGAILLVSKNKKLSNIKSNESMLFQIKRTESGEHTIKTNNPNEIEAPEKRAFQPQNLLHDDTKPVEKLNLLRNDKEPKESYTYVKSSNGITTLNGSKAKPMVFVDGKELFLGMDGLSSVKPETIESMSVIKEPAKLQLYGPRAKDGVILIKTKTNFIKTDDKK
ncbi:TonB family protein [Lacihabitans sp. CCS-44]|uniref:TonB family protein n=1 Tax=Lacihabitans sp. CCS-44 TaxID=2487331 RepID=UPI0020CB6F0B|nr:TonB family protein [Lacihabitans sp. CCS-44]MCP9757545.1 TonB family protein [Lacihabitans sp. CCS-44]